MAHIITTKGIIGTYKCNSLQLLEKKKKSKNIYGQNKVIDMTADWSKGIVYKKKK